AAALLISVSAMAGNNYKLPFVSFGIKAGYTTNQQKIDYKTLLNAESIKRNASGFNAGIVARVNFPLLPIYVQGELLYDWGRYKDVPLSGFTTNVTTNNFSVPVLVGVGIGSSNLVNIRANLGPAFKLVSTSYFSKTDRDVDRGNQHSPFQNHGGRPLQRRVLQKGHSQNRRPHVGEHTPHQLDVHHRLPFLNQITHGCLKGQSRSTVSNRSNFTGSQ